MRLLDTITGQFVEVFDVQRRPRYAILWHTWSSGGEQTYQELKVIQGTYNEKCVKDVHGTRNPPSLPTTTSPSSESSLSVAYALAGQSSSGPQLSLQGFESTCALPLAPATSPTRKAIWDDPRLSPKVRRACETARLNGYRYIWIDSCCIDKSSSSELSEAINSMYAWYRNLDMCYVYLADVPDLSYIALSSSRWFTRGWTLQELLAPRRIVFLSRVWSALGTKVTLKEPLEDITGISREVLLCTVPLDQISVARRMSWAAARKTTRVEDRAYSLFGIFDVNMGTLYGEGDRAFQRLLEEILRSIPDQSLFAWSEAPFYKTVMDEFVCRVPTLDPRIPRLEYWRCQ